MATGGLVLEIYALCVPGSFGIALLLNSAECPWSDLCVYLVGVSGITITVVLWLIRERWWERVLL